MKIEIQALGFCPYHSHPWEKCPNALLSVIFNRAYLGPFACSCVLCESLKIKNYEEHRGRQTLST